MTNEYQRQQKIRQQVADAAYKKRLQEANAPSIQEQAAKSVALENAKAALKPPKLTPAQKRLQQLEDDGAIPLANGGFLVGDTVYRPDGTVDHKLDQKDHLRTPEQMDKEENPFAAKGGVVQSDGTVWVPGKKLSVDVMAQSANGGWHLAHSYSEKELYGMILFDQTGKRVGDESKDEKQAANDYFDSHDGIPPSRGAEQSGYQSGSQQEQGNSEGNTNGPDVLDLPKQQDRGVRQYNDPAGPPAELAADQTALAEAAQAPAKASSGNIAGPAKPRGAPVHQRAPDTVPTQPGGHMTYSTLAGNYGQPTGMTYGPFNPYGAGQQGSWTGSWSDDDNYVPGFKMGGHMAIRGPATLYDDATGQPIAKLGENRPEELYGHPDGSVGIMNHIPSGLRGFATGGTITASGTPIVNSPPTATTGGNPPMANPPTATMGGNPPVAGQPSQPNQSYSGLSFPGTTIGGYSLQGLNAGTIPSSPFGYNGTGNIPQGQEPNQLESQSYGYLSGLQNYKNTFNTSLQNTLAGINTARQNALTQMAGAEANEPARLAAQHLREVYDPHYGMAGVAKPQEIAPPVGMFGTPSEPATTSGVGLRWQLQTPQEAYNRINQPLSEYESLIGKTASGVFSQITDAQDKARLIIAALKAENPSKPNPYGSGLVPSNQAPAGGNLTPQQQANDDAALLRAEMGLETGQTGTITLPSGLSVTYSGRKPKSGEEGGSGTRTPTRTPTKAPASSGGLASPLPAAPYGYIPGTYSPAQPGQMANFPTGYTPPAGYHLVGGPAGKAPGMIVKD